MIATYKREFDYPIWMEEEFRDNKLVRRWWNVRLWTGAVKQFDSREAAIEAYWK